MTFKAIEGIRRLQEHLLELGVARAVLSLPAPRMLALPSPTSEGAEPASVFARVITESEIERVARDLFVSGHYSIAVQEAYKAVDRFIADKTGRGSLSGTTLMELTFSPKSPILHWTDRRTQAELDEQAGYHRLYAGAMLGIRNPVAHEFNWVDEADVALELIVFAQHLLRKAKAARLDEPHARRKP
ncbi:TIGR02391 family protein [Methylocystis rosea]|uniref:TIGR02391 family protein n=1 Tax=Methylocystis rosea TaxID=173366 RepID=A0A3G8M0X4_9HYPH|nr:TIGR02391 family protein [Methylocystis rosea]AZG75599.1 TIGR02391 family protein [Methylocystis rosea]